MMMRIVLLLMGSSVRELLAWQHLQGDDDNVVTTNNNNRTAGGGGGGSSRGVNATTTTTTAAPAGPNKPNYGGGVGVLGGIIVGGGGGGVNNSTGAQGGSTNGTIIPSNTTSTGGTTNRTNNNTTTGNITIDYGDDDAYTWEDDDFRNFRSTWRNTDQFTYRHNLTTSPNNVYPPSQWLHVGCRNQTTCLGWPDPFQAKRSFDITNNHCVWCPADYPNSQDDYCHLHHSSPINLYRDAAVRGNPKYHPCIDLHYMHYLDSSCTFDMLVEADAFTIERHALTIKQPIDYWEEEGHYRNGCLVPGNGSAWGRIDFSRGFADFWLLSQIDIHVPSEHTQQGKRYDAEIQLYHFYSFDTRNTTSPTNQIATVSVFLEAYDDANDYDVLNKIICQYRRVEERTRRSCGLPSVYSTYPGCPVFTRGHPSSNGTDTSGSNGNRTSMTTNGTNSNHKSANTNRDRVRRRIQRGASVDDVEKSESLRARRPVPNENMGDSINEDYEDLHDRHRNLENEYANVSWHNYFPLLAVKTEYYYRYTGSMTIPPCFGRLRLGQDNLTNTNHWRVMKDPIPVSQRQIDELHRLIKSRIAPPDDPLRACGVDTAAVIPDPAVPHRISVARPLQSNNEGHGMVFCECENWHSKWPEDQSWCQLDKKTRFFDHPYNFPTNGF